MSEIDEAASVIAKTVDPDADIIFGAVVDEKMMDQVRITVIATRIDDDRYRVPGLRRETPTTSMPAQPTETKVTEPSEKVNVADTAASDERKTIDISSADDELVAEDEEFDTPAFLRRRS